MHQMTARPTNPSAPASSVRIVPRSPEGRLVRAGLGVAICVALGMGILAGPPAASSHHTVMSAPTHVAATSTTPDITGGPGNV